MFDLFFQWWFYIFLHHWFVIQYLVFFSSSIKYQWHFKVVSPYVQSISFQLNIIWCLESISFFTSIAYFQYNDFFGKKYNSLLSWFIHYWFDMIWYGGLYMANFNWFQLWAVNLNFVLGCTLLIWIFYLVISNSIVICNKH
jgi:hypothetical protein